MLRLSVQDESAVSYLPFPTEPLVLGSSKTAQLRCAFRGISRRHLRATPLGNRLLLEDLNSKNGLHVGGQKRESVVLKLGDSAQLGSARLQLEEISTADSVCALELDPNTGRGGSTVDETAEVHSGTLNSGPEAALKVLRTLAASSVRPWPPSAAVLEEIRRACGAIGALALESDSSSPEPTVLRAAGVIHPNADKSETSTLCSRPTKGNSSRKRIKLLLASEAPEDWQRDFITSLEGLFDSDRRASHNESCSRSHSPRLSFPPKFIPGTSPASLELLQRIRIAADSPLDVLLLGETGVGKELVVKTIQRSCERRERPYVALNCASLERELFEAHLFGVRRGAATGVEAKTGAVEAADGGILFLDEVSEIPISLQAKLLRLLQEREFWPVGASSSQHVDVRVIAATNTDLKADVAAGAFRADLYYRLRQLEIEVPPLRARPEDIPSLALELARRAAKLHCKALSGITQGALERLCHYDWPGNVRELENVLAEAVAATPCNGRIESGLFDKLPRPENPMARPGGKSYRLECARAQADFEVIRKALALTRNNKSAAARRLGVSRQGLNKIIQSLLEKHGLDPRPPST